MRSVFDFIVDTISGKLSICSPAARVFSLGKRGESEQGDLFVDVMSKQHLFYKEKWLITGSFLGLRLYNRFYNKNAPEYYLEELDTTLYTSLLRGFLFTKAKVNSLVDDSFNSDRFWVGFDNSLVQYDSLRPKVIIEGIAPIKLVQAGDGTLWCFRKN